MKKNFLFHDRTAEATVAAVLNQNSLDFGVAIRSEKDPCWVKKMGRKIAIGRAEKNPSKSVQVNVGDNLAKIFFSEGSLMLEEKMERRREYRAKKIKK